jgi:hypothetical protein
MDLRGQDSSGFQQNRRVSRWYLRCFVISVAKTQTPLVYDQPTVMWRMQRAEMSCYALIAPRPDGASVVWFVNNHPVGRRDFGDCGAALSWCDRLQMQNWSAGWRLTE